MIKLRVIIMLAGVSGGIMLASHLLSGPVRADQRVITAVHAITVSTVVANGESHSYVGSKKCKKCHIKQHKSWKKTRMANALDILKPGNSADTKGKFHVDVNKDYTADPACLKCHTTGYGKSGGYSTPNPEDKKAVRKAKSLAGVGCESCHGPGSEYVKVFADIMKSKRAYKVEELYAVGLKKVDENTCKTCHNDESPTINPGDLFDYEKRKEDGTHNHIVLKQRTE